MTGLTAIELRDDKPGHYHCADAIVAAARRLVPVDLHIVEIKRPAFAVPPLLSALVNRGSDAQHILSRYFRIDTATWPKADFLVSAGGDTLAANIAAARVLGIPNIFFGSLRRFRAADIALALNSYDTPEPAANQVTILKPSAADPDQLADPPRFESGAPRHAGLLIGGPAGTVRFTARDANRLLNLMTSAHAANGLTWIVSNSRRTPKSLSDRLTAMAQEPASPIEAFIDVRTAGPGTLGRLFRDCGLIVCTADSSAMLSEAIWMRRPVVSALLEDMALPANETAYRRRLSDARLCIEVPLAQLDAHILSGTLREIRPLRQNPLDDLAAVLAKHLPGVFPGPQPPDVTPIA